MQLFDGQFSIYTRVEYEPEKLKAIRMFLNRIENHITNDIEELLTDYLVDAMNSMTREERDALGDDFNPLISVTADAITY